MPLCRAPCRQQSVQLILQHHASSQGLLGNQCQRCSAEVTLSCNLLISVIYQPLCGFRGRQQCLLSRLSDTTLVTSFASTFAQPPCPSSSSEQGFPPGKGLRQLKIGHKRGNVCSELHGCAAPRLMLVLHCRDECGNTCSELNAGATPRRMLMLHCRNECGNVCSEPNAGAECWCCTAGATLSCTLTM